MKRMKRRTLAVCISLLLAAGSVIPVSAAGQDGNLTYASGVTKEMCTSTYWNDKSGTDSAGLLMSLEEIEELNRAVLAEKATFTNDLCSIGGSFDADPLRESLSKSEVPSKDIYIDGKKIDKDSFFADLSAAILSTGYRGMTSTRYAVASEMADLKAWPVDEIAGYSENDPDDELQSSSLCVNEPFVIRQKCETGGKTFYWGYTDNCTGWVNAESLAICSSKAEWEDAWKVDITGDDFLVVTQDKIVLEKNIIDPSVSKLTLSLGSVLRLVPADQIPSTISGRGSWNNHVVYVPARDADGSYRKTMALISQHHNVSIGFEELTGSNVLRIAFSCLGNRYGWGGMLEADDCSGYTRNIYRCFGLLMPRNTTWQRAIPGRCINISALSEDQKTAYINKLPAGSLLYFPGHTMVYAGSSDGIPYVISALGSAADSGDGEAVVKTIYSVALNPLTVRRRNGSTWTSNITDVVVFGNRIPDPASAVYSDLDGYYYAKEAVLYVSSRGILNGTGPESFSPGLDMSRGMLLTALARMDGQDTSGGSVWYEKGLEWAIEKGISDGSSPQASVTREQLAAILYRSAGSPDPDAGAKAELFSDDSRFTDADQISGYAADAMAWAVERGVMTGSDDGKLSPSAPASRAQVAVMLERYCALS